jgi:hypothetical protein
MGHRRSKPRRVFLLVLASLACGGAKETTMSGDDQARRSLLDAAIRASGEEAFGQALTAHGPVRDDEIPYLDASALQGNGRHKLNAARLLSIAPHGADRDAALRHVVKETRDADVWAAALSPLLPERDAKELAGSRMDMLHAALDADGLELGVAMRAGAMVGDEEALRVARQRLAEADAKARAAAVSALAATEGGAGPLEPELLAVLEKEGARDVLLALYRALIASDDQATHRALLEHFGRANRDDRNALAFAFRQSDRPWVRSHWLERARADGEEREIATYIVAGRPDADALRLCLELYDRMSKGDAATRRSADPGPCDEMLSKLAGRRVFGAGARDFAREWLAQHEK